MKSFALEFFIAARFVNLAVSLPHYQFASHTTLQVDDALVGYPKTELESFGRIPSPRPSLRRIPMTRLQLAATLTLLAVSLVLLTGVNREQAFWSQWGRNSQHTGMVNVPAQPLDTTKEPADINQLCANPSRFPSPEYREPVLDESQFESYRHGLFGKRRLRQLTLRDFLHPEYRKQLPFRSSGR